MTKSSAKRFISAAIALALLLALLLPLLSVGLPAGLATTQAEAQNGWKVPSSSEDDPHYYYYIDNKKATGWHELDTPPDYTGMIDGKAWFYFKPGTTTRPDGSMYTGWLKDGGNWYFLNSNGTMATGWVNSGGNWYYLNPNGTMVTGWKHIPYQGGSKWFYFAPAGSGYTEGSMYTGIRSINGRQNRFDNSGAWLGYV